MQQGESPRRQIAEPNKRGAIGATRLMQFDDVLYNNSTCTRMNGISEVKDSQSEN